MLSCVISEEGKKEMVSLILNDAFKKFLKNIIYVYMVSNIWLRTTEIMREQTSANTLSVTISVL